MVLLSGMLNPEVDVVLFAWSHKAGTAGAAKGELLA